MMTSKSKPPPSETNPIHYRWQRFVGDRGNREKFLLGPALEAYPDMSNYRDTKIRKRFLKKHI